jgi:hypothetical protein
MKRIDIQVSKPSDYIVPEDIQTLLLINQSLDSSFVNWANSSLNKLMVKKNMALDTLLFDSTAVDTSLQIAAITLFESGRFDVVIPLDYNYPKQEADKEGLLLRWDLVESLCKNYGADALVAQESFVQHISTDFDSGFSLDRGVLYTGAIDVVYATYWRIYKPSDRLSQALYVKDTIFLELLRWECPKDVG